MHCVTEGRSVPRLLARLFEQTWPGHSSSICWSSSSSSSFPSEAPEAPEAPRRAAMFSCRAAWQRCGPLARRTAYRSPRNGEFHQAADTTQTTLYYIMYVFERAVVFDLCWVHSVLMWISLHGCTPRLERDNGCLCFVKVRKIFDWSQSEKL